jgi:hypothetical protein
LLIFFDIFVQVSPQRDSDVIPCSQLDLLNSSRGSLIDRFNVVSRCVSRAHLVNEGHFLIRSLRIKI